MWIRVYSAQTIFWVYWHLVLLQKTDEFWAKVPQMVSEVVAKARGDVAKKWRRIYKEYAADAKSRIEDEDED